MRSWGYEYPEDIPPGWKGGKDSWPMHEPVVSQLTKPWSREQKRSWETHHCSLDQLVLSKEVKDQQGKKTKEFSGEKGEARKGRGHLQGHC